MPTHSEVIERLSVDLDALRAENARLRAVVEAGRTYVGALLDESIPGATPEQWCAYRDALRALDAGQAQEARP